MLFMLWNHFLKVSGLGLVLLSCNSGSNTPIETDLDSAAWVELGKSLFFETAWSKNGDVSCAHCHRPEFGFSDTLQKAGGNALGVPARNIPSLLGVSKKTLLNWDGGVRSLEEQALIPLHAEGDFGLTPTESLHRLQGKEYLKKWRYSLDLRTAVTALARFQETLHFPEPVMDKNYLAGLEWIQNQNCQQCHAGPSFSDGKFHRLKGVKTSADLGRYRITSNPQDSFAFITPTLSTSWLSPPFLHNGQAKNLHEAMKAHGLEFSQAEIQILELFLQRLAGMAAENPI